MGELSPPHESLPSGADGVGKISKAKDALLVERVPRAASSFISDHSADPEMAKAIQTFKKRDSVEKSIDICFLIDATESMKNIIGKNGTAPKQLSRVIKEIEKELGSDTVIRVAVVAYRDYPDVKTSKEDDFEEG